MIRFLQLILFSSVLFCSPIVHAQLTVENETNAMNLAQKILGPGVTILNAQYKGSNVSAGTFNAVTGSFPLTSGIVLTSGRAKTTGTLPGQRGVDGLANYNQSEVFQASLSHNITNDPGDPDLTFYSNKRTYDASVLEFDFIPQGDSINVRYIFGSEEYPEFTCSEYNDVFAFLITGPGFSGPANIALVPNTNIPVAINSINNGLPGPGEGNPANCTNMGAGSPFTQYYISNQGGTVYTYNGRTIVLTAKVKVQPCQVYHIKLAIADAFDRIWDSGVFIEAGSFSSKPEFKPSITGTMVNTNNNVVLVEACKTAELKITRSENTVGPFTVNITYGGTATAGTDYTALPAQVNFGANENEKTFQLSAVADAFNEGTEKAELYFSKNLACSQELADSIVIFIQDSTITTSKTDTFICSNTSTIIKSKEPVANTTNTYLWNNGSTTQSILVTQPGKYFVSHTYSQRCINTDTFVVQNMDPTFSNPNIDPVVCPGTPAMLNIITNADSIKWNTGATSNSITVTNAGTYWVTVKNIWGCIRSDTIDVAERSSPVLELGSDTSICAGESIRLDAFYAGAVYLWSNGATASFINVSNIGLYTVESTLNGCTSTDSVTISQKKMPVADAGMDLTIPQHTSVQLNAVQHADNATYLWSPGFSLSNPSVSNPVATPTVSTEYNLRVISVDGCISQDKVWVNIQYPLNIPNAFSPNGDNINDTWRIGNIQYYPASRISIYNRYGQPMYSSTGYAQPWDGSFRGKALEPATYYYVIEPGDGRKFSGWLLLLR